jgi:hypothetical protein
MVGPAHGHGMASKPCSRGTRGACGSGRCRSPARRPPRASHGRAAGRSGGRARAAGAAGADVVGGGGRGRRGRGSAGACCSRCTLWKRPACPGGGVPRYCRVFWGQQPPPATHTPDSCHQALDRARCCAPLCFTAAAACLPPLPPHDAPTAHRLPAPPATPPARAPFPRSAPIAPQDEFRDPISYMVGSVGLSLRTSVPCGCLGRWLGGSQPSLLPARPLQTWRGVACDGRHMASRARGAASCQPHLARGTRAAGRLPPVGPPHTCQHASAAADQAARCVPHRHSGVPPHITRTPPA